MRCKVNRITIKDWNTLLASKTGTVELIPVPGTIADVWYKGLFSDEKKKEVSIAWPVDRPYFMQEEFAKDCCQGSWPQEYVDIKKARRSHNFSVIQGGRS